MRTRWLVQIGIFVLVGSASSRFVNAQDAVAVGPWRTGVAITCPSGRVIPRNTPLSGSNVTAADLCGSDPAPAARTAAPSSLSEALKPAVQSLGFSAGQALGNWLLGGGNKPATPPIPLIDPAQQQRELAARQLNNSGLYLLKQKTSSGTIAAINEFQKALEQTPNDADILHNLALAKQQLKDITAAGQTSAALSHVLGPAPPVNTELFGDQLTHSSVANPNASALSLVNLDSNVVDLRGTTKTFVNPALLKNDPANSASADHPQMAEDLDKLFDRSMNASEVTSQAQVDKRKVDHPQTVEDLDKLFDRSMNASEVESQGQDAKLEREFQQTVPEINKQLLGVQDTQQRIQDESKNAQPASSGSQPRN
jgi:hypothetical protein